MPQVMSTTRLGSEGDGCSAVRSASGNWILLFAIALILLGIELVEGGLE